MNKQANILAGQKKLVEQKLAFEGLATDDLVGAKYRHDSVHFGQLGLEIHGQRRFDVIKNCFHFELLVEFFVSPHNPFPTLKKGSILKTSIP